LFSLIRIIDGDVPPRVPNHAVDVGVGLGPRSTTSFFTGSIVGCCLDNLLPSLLLVALNLGKLANAIEVGFGI
jgi:hypothetical protein